MSATTALSVVSCPLSARMSDMVSRFRSRLKFSLRTLLVLVTLLCLYLGWQKQRINERDDIIRWTQADLPMPYHLRDGDKVLLCCHEPEVPWLRRQLGDNQYFWSCMYPNDPNDVARILAAFPSVETRQFVAATRKLVPLEDLARKPSK